MRVNLERMYERLASLRARIANLATELRLIDADAQIIEDEVRVAINTEGA